MRENFLIKQDLVEQATECEDALAVYALIESLRDDDDFLPYLMTSEQALSVYLFGKSPSRSQRTRIKNGLIYLQKMNYVQIKECGHSLIKVYLNELHNEKQDNKDLILLHAEDLLNVFQANTKMNKFRLYMTFCMIVRHMDNSTDDKEYQNKLCRLPSYYMALKLNISPTTFGQYLHELERLKIIYIHYTDGRYNPVIRTRETNIYCRFSDQKLCDKYANKMGYSQEPFYIHNINLRRKMKQIYNQICKGKINYSEDTYDKLIDYIMATDVNNNLDINIVYEAQQKALKNCN